MSKDDNRETLSAALDDAADSADLGVVIDEHAGDALHHYQLIGDAMRGDLSEASMIDVSIQVRDAIAGEHVSEVVADVAPARQATGSSAGSSWFDLTSWLRPVGGLAIAASVAMVVVVSLDQSEVDTGIPAGQVVATTEKPADQQGMDDSSVVTVADKKPVDLRHYLDEHSEFAAQDTMQGRLPYIRAVGYKESR